MKTTDDKLLEKMETLSKKKSVDINSIKQKVLILSTPRCGSSMFNDVLNNTEKLGTCAEWFNPRYLAAYGKMTGNSNVQFNKYLTFIMEKTVGDTGVFVVNAHIEQILFFAQKKVNLLNIKFDSIIYLYRKDKLSQAVSLAKARLTDSWSSDIKGNTEKLSKMCNADIVTALKHIVDSEKSYQDSLAKFTDKEYAYEDFCKLEATSIYNELFEQLSVDFSGGIKTNRKKQRDSFSKKAIVNFKKYILGN